MRFWVDRERAWCPCIWIGRFAVDVGRDYCGKRFHLTFHWQGRDEAHDLAWTPVRW